MREIEILKANLSTRKSIITTDFVAEEQPLHIFLNKTHVVTIFCSPHQLRELALGHALSEGLIVNHNEIHEILFEEDKQKCYIKLKPDINVEKRLAFVKPYARLITSSCNPPEYGPFPKLIDRIKIPKVNSNLVVKVETISNCVKSLNTIAKTFRKTGGVHVAALHKKNGDLVTLAEDVGRHNAVDKVIGAQALNNSSFSGCFLTLSGRLTGDIVLKAARTKLAIVASQAAAIESGIEVAEHCRITLIGFARGKRLNVYTFPERVSF
jgi:FdhD protein